MSVAMANVVVAGLQLSVDSATPKGGDSCDDTGPSVAFDTSVKSNQSAADWDSQVASIKADVGEAPSITALGDRAVGAIRILAVQKVSTIIVLNGQVDNTGSPAQNVVDLSMLASVMLDNVT